MEAPRSETELLNWLLTSAAEAMLIVDAQGLITLANPSAEQLFKTGPDGLNGQALDGLLPNRFRHHHGALRERYQAQPHPRPMGVGIELYAVRSNGEEFPVEISLSPLTTASGMRLVMATVHDITPRKQAELALRDSEARLRAIIDSAIDAIISIDESGLIERVNPRVTQMFGYTEAEMIGKNVSMLMPNPDRMQHDDYLARYRKTGKARVIGIGRETIAQRKDGSTFPVDLSVAAVDIEGRRIYTGILRDISQRRQAEARFRILVEQIRAITYIASAQDPQHFEYVSPQIDALGYTPIEWLVTPGLLQQCMHADDRERVCALLRQRAANGQPARIEYRLISRGGETLWFRDEARPVLDEVGAHTLFIQGLLVDITQDKLNETMLRQSREAMRSFAAHQEHIKESERKRIAQEIHDELGSLLTGIKAHISVSIERATQAQQPVDPLLSNASHLADEAIAAVRRVITDLRPSVLDQLGVWEAISWYASQVGARTDLTCSSTIEESVEDTELDPERSTMVFRIVQEALTNVQRHACATHATIHAQRTADTLNIEISDNGHGFEPNQLTERSSWGILGMRERAHHFGGRLDIDSRPGTGTRVMLTLPIAPESDPKASGNAT